MRLSEKGPVQCSIRFRLVFTEFLLININAVAIVTAAVTRFLFSIVTALLLRMRDDMTECNTNLEFPACRKH